MTTTSSETFGALLRQHRLAAGLTQEELAERAGLSQRGVQDLERGVRATPRPETVRMLADALALDAAARSALIAAAHPELAAARPRPALALHVAAPPIPPTPLVGREGEVATVCALLRRSELRLLTLTGPGGVGKTRLALAVAAELAADFADGAAWVELAPLRDPSLVPGALVQALGLGESPDDSLSDTLQVALAGRRLLLILDNCEHLLPAMPLVASLLAANPGLVVMATSRTRLRLRGEREHPVPPLAVPATTAGAASPLAGLSGVAAVRLFVERAAEVRPGFALTADNAAAVTAICRRVEGIPLAIELAAARIKLLPPAQVLARLDQRLPLLTGGAQDLPLRQQTMRDTIAWSYDLLPEVEQVCFRRLAVFVGGFTLEAADAAVSRGVEESRSREENGPLSSTPFDLLASLVDQSLLRPLDSADGEPRFAFLETMREFALERLAVNGETERARREHAAFFLALTERAERELTGPAQGDWLNRLEVEHDNLRAALAWAIEHDAIAAVRMAGALWRFWYMRGHLREGRGWAEAALARGGGAPAARAKAFHAAGDLAQEQGDYAGAAPLLEAGLAAAEMARDHAVAALCLAGLGFIARNQGIYEQAAELHERALALQRGLGDRRGVACTLANLGSIAQHRREAERAEALFAEALATFHALGDRPLAADVAVNLAILANQSGDHARAGGLAADALTTYRHLGDRQAIATALLALANAARHQGEREHAVEVYEEALALFRAVDHEQGITSALTRLASMALDGGQTAPACARLAESLGILQQSTDKPSIADALDAASCAASALGRWEDAAQVMGAAAALRREIGGELADDGQRRLSAEVSAALGEAAFAASYAAGQAMTVERAIATALRATDALAALRAGLDLSPSASPVTAPP
jgi:predicted ATPase/DNA-binding XRE family transcriptional regulator